MIELRPGLLFAHYRLKRKLAFGGMGDVYLARDERAGGALVAVKILQRDRCGDARRVRAFHDEAELAERMDHSSLVQVLGRGEWRGWHYLAMEWVNGVSLTELVEAMRARGQRLSTGALSFLARRICAALHHAHEQVDDDGRPLRVVHRDVTPRNVMVSLDGEVKVIDFGIARTRRSGSSTGAGEIKGTLEFLSPEQLAGIPVDRRADIHGAALTIFYAAAQQSPFWRGDEAKTLGAIAREPLPGLRALRADLPVELEQALGRAAHKEPKERFATARDFARALPVASQDAEEELAGLVRQLFGLRPVPLRSYGEAERPAAPAGWRRWGLAFATAAVVVSLGLAGMDSASAPAPSRAPEGAKLEAAQSRVQGRSSAPRYRKVGRPR